MKAQSSKKTVPRYVIPKKSAIGSISNFIESTRPVTVSVADAQIQHIEF
jgi:hypothetical protein